MLQNSGRSPPRDTGSDLQLSGLGGGSTATLTPSAVAPQSTLGDDESALGK